MHLIVALHSTALLAIALALALGIAVGETTLLRRTIADHTMAKKSLHLAGHCPRSTMPSCRVLLPDERPDRVIKETKVQRARRGAAQAIDRFTDREY